MPVTITDEPWVPAQERFESGEDVRGLEAGRASRKRARQVEENGLEDEEMVNEEEVDAYRKRHRPTYKQVLGKVSGRAWKAPAARASSFKQAQLGGVKSWDDRMKEKAAKKAFQTKMKEASDEARAARKAEHERRAAKKAQKEENRRKSAAVFQQEITNPKTIAKRAESKERKKQKALKMV